MELLLMDPLLGPRIIAAGARIGAAVLPEPAAVEVDELDDLRLTPSIRQILEPLLTILGYVIEESLATYQNVKYRHAVVRKVRNGDDRRLVIHIPQKFLDGSRGHNKELVCMLTPFKKTYGEGVTIYLFSENCDAAATRCKALFKDVWQDDYEITVEFVAWSEVKALTLATESANGSGMNQRIEGEKLDESIEKLKLLLELKPGPQPIATLSQGEQTKLIVYLSGYAKLGYDGGARRNFLVTIGIPAPFIDQNITLNAALQFEYATCLATRLADSPAVMKPLIHYIAKLDETCPDATKAWFLTLIEKYADLKV
jgi:hypothetical protein